MNFHRALLFLALLLSSPISANALERCTLKSSDARSTLLSCHKLDVLLLQGNGEERAEAFGARLKQGDLNPNLVNYFAQRLLADFASYPQPIRWLAETALNGVAKFFFAKVDPRMSQEVKAMAKGMGVEPAYLMRAALLPDFSTYLNAFAGEWPIRSLPPREWC